MMPGGLIKLNTLSMMKGYARQVHEGGARSLLLSSSRGEAKLWDAGACRDAAEALWGPPEAVGDPLRTFERIRNAVFRADGCVVRTSHVKDSPPAIGCEDVNGCCWFLPQLWTVSFEAL